CRVQRSAPRSALWSSSTRQVSVFFFQAEDGIRAFHVTGVQTCALPIFLAALGGCSAPDAAEPPAPPPPPPPPAACLLDTAALEEIGRASCRERGSVGRDDRGARTTTRQIGTASMPASLAGRSERPDRPR